MSTVETIALIRDIAIIAAAGVIVVVHLVGGLILLKVYRETYRSLRRAAQKFEQSSDIILNIFLQPLNLVASVVDLVVRVLGVVEQFRNRDRRKEDDED